MQEDQILLPENFDGAIDLFDRAHPSGEDDWLASCTRVTEQIVVGEGGRGNLEAGDIKLRYDIDGCFVPGRSVPVNLDLTAIANNDRQFGRSAWRRFPQYDPAATEWIEARRGQPYVSPALPRCCGSVERAAALAGNTLRIVALAVDLPDSLGNQFKSGQRKVPGT